MRGKRGQGGGGGGGGGGDPMQMISVILMIVSLIIGMSGQCKEKKEDEKNIAPDMSVKNIPGPTVLPKTCSELGGFQCDPLTQICHGEKLPASDNTMEKICYSQPPTSLETKVTEATQSCAAQKGFNCGLEKYCPNNQWISAKDTQMCCQVSCIDRIQTTTVFPVLGEVVVERFDTTSFGVWYGSDPQTKAFDANAGFKVIGHPNFARARGIGSNKYEFSVDEKKYSFTVTKNEAAEIAVSVG